METGYYEAYNRDNVLLVDVCETPIERITPKGIKTSDREYEFDIIIYATGFDAITGALTRIDIRGEGGQTIKDKWASGPRTYLYEFLMIVGHCAEVCSCFDKLSTKGSSVPVDTFAVRPEPVEGRPLMDIHQRETVLGIQVVGFPNLFIATNTAFCNYTVCAEMIAEWISDCIRYVREKGFTRIAPTPQAEEAWVEHANELASHTFLNEAKTA